MTKRLVFALFILVITVGAVLAQDSDTPSCDPSVYAELLQEGIDRLDAGDDPTEVMMDVDLAIGNARAECAGWLFTSDEYSMNPSVGPITLEEGIYRVAFEAGEISTLSVTPLTDDCGFDIEYLTTFGSSTQSVDVEADCELLVDITSLDSDWTLQFERVR